VLVLGASGGVGTAAVQVRFMVLHVLQMLGARVLAVASAARLDMAACIKQQVACPCDVAAFPLLIFCFYMPLSMLSYCTMHISKLLGAEVVAVTSGADKADAAEMC
jgi:NADPH:quinone reductase-like Zn-dependent oxidoreductase